MSSKFFTVHKNQIGAVLDSNKQKVNTAKLSGGVLSADYEYRGPFQNSDILEIRAGRKTYILKNFILTATANYSMGGPIVRGCRIDSADINGKRRALDQHIIIYNSDNY
ncbi:hypothetical protein [Pedobacter borealis]|uniref:hypothetical protein n=1 Tax=Pedobacter borealis TaxID=475254 RepID=UPI0012F9EF4F|nr:hypothetical protein [Pedobacter borealis]